VNVPGQGQAVRLASGSLLQQIAQVTGLVAMFAVITVLARRLPLPEFGIYGLLTSLAGYLLVVQNAAAGAAVRTMAAATSGSGRRASFSTALTLYAAAGAAAGVLVALLGIVLAETVSLPPGAAREARLGSLLLGLVTALGWPATIWRDALRASQLFSRAAVTEIVALIAYVGLLLGLIYTGAGLAALIAASGSIPLLVGLGCLAVARTAGVPFSFSRGAVTAASARELLRLGGYLSLTEAAAAAIYTVNRAVLGLFTSAATVGLFEGPVRAHNVIRALNSAVTVTALPTAARYQADSDERRQSELLLRGTRYTLALIVPLAVTSMVLAGPLLGAWLGSGFRQASGTMAILMSHWLVNGCSGVLIAILVGVGRAPQVARYAGAVALGDVVLALILTPLLGLEAVAIATAAPYVAMFPVLLRLALRETGTHADEVLRSSFLPAWSLGAALAAGLGLLRIAVDLDTVPAVAGAVVGGLATYWGAYYAVWLDPGERRLVREVARLAFSRDR
jgi:O-antigen/teichoic acid export membrane protein